MEIKKHRKKKRLSILPWKK